MPVCRDTFCRSQQEAPCCVACRTCRYTQFCRCDETQNTSKIQQWNYQHQQPQVSLATDILTAIIMCKFSQFYDCAKPEPKTTKNVFVTDRKTLYLHRCKHVQQKTVKIDFLNSYVIENRLQNAYRY